MSAMGLFTLIISTLALNKGGLIQPNMTWFFAVDKEIWPIIGYICLSDQIKGEQYKTPIKT
ncbi:hypothetical protein TUM3792_40500 [Shewanella sp. MBTL60-007]|nr:hypothetical protein TUM3792_40500 [Shewanella sp. MBTL60-007]